MLELTNTLFIVPEMLNEYLTVVAQDGLIHFIASTL